MATLLELEQPQIKEPTRPGQIAIVGARPLRTSWPNQPALFSDVLLESAAPEQRQRGYDYRTASGQGAPHPGSSRDRGRQTMALSALLAEWRAGRGGNLHNGNIPDC